MEALLAAMTRILRWHRWARFFGYGLLFVAMAELCAIALSYRWARELWIATPNNTTTIIMLDGASAAVCIYGPVVPNGSPRTMPPGRVLYLYRSRCSYGTFFVMCTHGHTWNAFHPEEEPPLLQFRRPFLGVRYGTATWRGICGRNIVFPPIYAYLLTAATAALGLWLVIRGRSARGTGFPILPLPGQEGGDDAFRR
jgi:hypothetical protein